MYIIIRELVLFIGSLVLFLSDGTAAQSSNETSCGKAAISDVMIWAKKLFQEEEEIRQAFVGTYTPAANTSLTLTAKLESHPGKAGVEEVHEFLVLTFQENGLNRTYNFQQTHPVILINQTIVYERRGNDTPRNCEEIQLSGKTTSGIYLIYPYTGRLQYLSVEVYCDLVTDGGGWTVIQRRQPPGTESFQRNWFDYEKGFGAPNSSHWIGLSAISALTVSGDSSIRIDLASYSGEKRLAEYRYFRIENATTNYRLNVDDYSGNANDALSYHNRIQFSTYDRDNDPGRTSARWKGGWWYNNGHWSNLNGLYIDTTKTNPEHGTVVSWHPWLGVNVALQFTEMKVRSRSFKSKA